MHLFNLKRIFFWVFVLIFNFETALAQSTVPKSVNAYIKAWSQRKLSPLFLYLSDQMAVNMYSRPVALDYAGNILSKFKPNDTVIVSYLSQKELDDGKTAIRLSYQINALPAITSKIYLDRNGDLISSDFWDSIAGMKKTAVSQLVASFPIEIVNGSIAIRVGVNRSTKKFLFLFDTGADGMAIRKSLADSLGIKTAFSKATKFVGASRRVDIAKLDYQLDTVVLKAQSTAIFDKIDTVFDGIIGAKYFLTHYITKVDLDSRHIYLYTFSDHMASDVKGEPTDMLYDGIPKILASVVFNSGKPYKGKFVFDTGAGFDMILFSLFVHRNELLQDFTPIGSSTTISMGHSIIPLHNWTTC